MAIQKFSDYKKEQEEKQQTLNIQKFSDYAKENNINYTVKKILPTKNSTGNNVGATLGNLGLLLGKGAVNKGEGILDFLNDWTGKTTSAAFKLIGRDDLAQEETESRKNFIERDLTQELGTSTRASQQITKNEQNGSLLTRNNLGGQIVQAVGGQLPTLAIGALTGGGGLNSAINSSSMGTLGKIGTTALLNAPTNAMLASSSYGGALQEAYLNGATEEEATKYAIGSTAVEIASEWITGGIPGTNGKGGIDVFADKGIDKISNKLVQDLVRYGYKMVGEGVEEGFAEIMSPILKNATYTSGEKINWQDVLNSAIVGGISAGIIEAPNTVSNISNDIRQNKNNTKLSTVQDLVKQEQTSNTNSNQVNLPTVNDIAKNSINTNETSNQSLPVKKLNFIESARKYNIDTNNDTIRSINKTLSQRNINASWDDTVFKSNKQNALWKLNSDGTREIVFNPKAETGDLLQNVAIHELYHDLTTSQNGNVIKNEILEFAKTKEGYQEARLDLEKTYLEIYDKNSPEFQQLVDEEVVASVLGNKLGDQQFVSQLTMQKPSLARQIYNWVVDKLNTLNKSIGYKSERLFWEDIKNKFENAYREEFNVSQSNSSDTRYMITGLKGVRNGIKADSDNQWALDSYNKAQKMVERGYSNEEVRQKTWWFQDQNGDWKFEISDENASLIKSIKKDTNYRLGEILQHDALFEMYPKAKNIKVKFANISDVKDPNGKNHKINGRINKITNAIYINNNLIDAGKDATLNTLIHEIQHYVQKLEKFQRGTSVTLGKDAYNNNLGEIEAKDTSKRRKLTEEDRKNIAPKSSLTKQSIKTVDKNNFSLYNNDIEANYENNKENNGLYQKNVRGNILHRVSKGLDNSSFSINENSNWQEHLEKNYQSTGKGQTLQDVKLPTRKDVNKINMPPVEKKNIPSKKSKEIAKILNETMQDNKIETKQRSWIETSLESESIKDKLFIENLDTNKINYVVQSNKKTLEQANNKINSMGYETSVKYIQSKINDNDISLTDIVLAERLIQEALNNGDNQLASDLLMDTAIMGTELGQKVQALSIIQRLTPEGQLKFYQKLVQRAKAKGETSFKNVEITPEMVDLILNAYNSDGTFDQNDLNDRVEQFKQKVADQLITTNSEKVVSWRYLSMLGNPKTHIRNIVSNVAMWGTLKVKNATARTLETVLPVKNRTKTWEKASNVVSDFAKKTTNEMQGVITGEGKYNEKTSIENKKQTFKNKTLEKLKDFNSNLLSKEDWMFSKNAFENTFKEYLTANGIKTENDITNNSEIIEKAKLYALEQAEIATFRQYSWLASQISKIENKNTLTKVAVGSTIPFKKTPINIAKTGVKYSPIGLIKSISYDAYQVSKGNMEASQMIDNLSQGLVGSSLALIGYALAKSGILKGAGDEDKEGKYDSYLGNQTYSVKIGDATYSISWLSPVAMPLLVGATAYEKLEEQSEWDMNVVIDTLAQTLDPLSEMSFLSSLDDVLSSYDSGVKKIAGMVGSMTQNYLTQFIPTIVSQFASTLDDKKRTTRASNNSSFKYGEETARKLMYKIPILRNQLEVSTDIWGNEINQSDNIIERALENFIAPYSKKEDITTSLDKELKRIYNSTGETSVIPGVPKAFVKYDDVTYQMSASEYTQYKKTYGKIANNYLSSLINNVNYKNSTDEEKVKMIKEIYDFASATANEEYFSNKSVNYETDTLKEVQKIKELKMTDEQLAEYVAQKKIISTIKNDENITTQEKKIKICKNLINTNLNDEQLVYLYNKYYSSEKTLNSLLNANVPIKEFIKFNSQEFTTDYYDNGKAITNSRKNKVIKYINSLNLSIPQKAILIKMEYNSYDNYNSQIVNYINKMNYSKFEKASLLKSFGFDNYDKYLVSYVNNMNISKEEKTDMLEELGFTIRDGKVYY